MLYRGGILHPQIKRSVFRVRKIEDMEIGIRIRQLRNDLGYDQKEMADQIGSSPQALSNWENGKNKPKAIMLEKIARLADVHPNEIIYGDLESFLKSNISNSLNTDATFIVDYSSEETMNMMLNALNNEESPYDFSSLSSVIRRYERKMIVDYFKSTYCNDRDFLNSVREGMIGKGIDELSNYAILISEKSHESYEKILNLLMYVANIDSSNIVIDGLEKNLPIKKSELRIGWFSHDTEKQIPTGQTNVYNFFDLKYWLNREPNYFEYTKSEEKGVRIKRKNVPVHYNGKELTVADLQKIENFVKSLT